MTVAFIQATKQGQSAHSAWHKIFNVKPSKAEGDKPGLGKPSAKEKKLSTDFLLYGGGNDKIRRVVRGNPRPPLNLKAIRYQLDTRVMAMRFGKRAVTALTRANQDGDGQARRMAHQTTEKGENLDDTLFICCYKQFNKTVIQLENTRTGDVLDSVALSGHHEGHKTGVTCIQMAGYEKVVGIFAGHMFTLDIVNKKLTQPHFFEMEYVKHISTCQFTGNIAVLTGDQQVFIGHIFQHNFEIFDHIKLTIQEEIASVDYNGDELFLATIYGCVMNYKKHGQEWYFHKKYASYKKRVLKLHSHYGREVFSISGEDNMIMVYYSGHKKQIQIKNKSTALPETNQVIYMEIVGRNLFYACKNGHTGNIQIS